MARIAEDTTIVRNCGAGCTSGRKARPPRLCVAQGDGGWPAISCRLSGDGHAAYLSATKRDNRIFRALADRLKRKPPEPQVAEPPRKKKRV